MEGHTMPMEIIAKQSKTNDTRGFVLSFKIVKFASPNFVIAWDNVRKVNEMNMFKNQLELFANEAHVLRAHNG